MVNFVLATAFLALGSVVSASPAPVKGIGGGGVSFGALSGQYDYEDIGHYIIYNNLFGLSQSGTRGSQTTQPYPLGAVISWKTGYTWEGNPGNVKSYANVAVKGGLGNKLSNIHNIPTMWVWTYITESNALDADVSYDLWLSNGPNLCTACRTSKFEIMIWLSARGGAKPTGSKIASRIKIGGLLWDIYKGQITAGNPGSSYTWGVYSFVAIHELRGYHANLLHFFEYLNKHYKISLDHYLVALQAGTEPFTGSATLLTKLYYAAIY